jgi:hypothetical protein
MSNEDIITKRMLNTIRQVKSDRAKRLMEEYEGDYNESSEEVVSEEKYPGIRGQIIDPLLQKIPNVKLEDDGLTVNKENSTITLEGVIPSLSNLKFIVITDTSNTEPLHVSVENLNLSEDGLTSLTALYAFAKTFYNEWSINKVKETFK